MFNLGKNFAILLTCLAPFTGALTLGKDASIDTRAVRYSSINLARFNGLERRVDIHECATGVDHLDTPFKIGVSSLPTIGNHIAQAIKGDSDNRDCGEKHGQEDGGLTWSFLATGSECTTTAEIKTILGAVDNYLKNKVDGSSTSWCIRMTHGDDKWDGFLALSSQPGADANRCTNLQYGACDNVGGSADQGEGN